MTAGLGCWRFALGALESGWLGMEGLGRTRNRMGWDSTENIV
jgi:hypothetical protein